MLVMRSRLLAPLALVLLAGSVSCGDGPTGPDAPRAPVLVLPNAIGSGRILAGDSLEFITYLDYITNHRISLRANSGSGEDTLVLVVRDSATGTFLTEVRSAGDQQQQHDAMVFFDPPGDGIVARIVVRGARATDEGEFTFMVRTPDAAPEHVPAQIAIGDTVTGEWFDGGNDLDIWEFEAAAGEELLIRAGFEEITEFVNGATADVGVYRASDPLGWRQLTIDTAAFDLNALVVAVQSTGTHRLSIGGAAIWRGRYRVSMERRDRAPESAAATVAVGDTISESIDEIADIDEFSFTATAGAELMLNVASGDTWPSGLRFTVLDGSEALFATTLHVPTPSLDLAGAPRWAVPHAGTFRLRVQPEASGPRPTVTGPYRFELYRVDRAPEIVSAVIPFGGAMSGETIGRRGDIDEFTIAVDSAQMYVGNFISQRGDRAGSTLAVLTSPGGAELNRWRHEGAAFQRDSTLVGEHQYLNIGGTQPAGTHRLQVSGDPSVGNSYAFRTYGIDPQPEALAPVVPIDTWIEGESIGVIGDIDRFRVPLVAGRTYAFELEAATEPDQTIEIRSDLFGLRSLGNGPSGLTRIVPATTGEVTLAVSGTSPALNAVRPYRFRILENDPRNETADSVFAIGDTVSGEGIEEFGDIDQFLITMSDADSLRVVFDYPTAPGRDIVVFVTDAVTGELACCSFGHTANSIYHWRAPYPGSRLYRLTVMGNGSSRTSVVGAYTLAILRIP